MRYVEGSDLRTVLGDAGTLAPERALGILAQVAAALDAAHKRDLVHRDVKPANILLDADEHAYLTDFGVTKHVGGDTTDTEAVVGTLDYLAPEQIRGGAIDGRADEYALACVLYECLSGTPPFWRETQAEAMWAHLSDEPPPLSPALDPVLRRGLAKDPNDRYATCGELIAAARAALAPGARCAAAAAHGAGRWPWAARSCSPPRWPRCSPRPAASAPSRPRGQRRRDARRRRAGRCARSSSRPRTRATSPSARARSGCSAPRTRPSREIDPRTQAVLGRFAARSLPSALAAGGGAVWVGNGRSIERQRQRDGQRLAGRPPRRGGSPIPSQLPNLEHGEGAWALGLTQLVVGDGAVWARDPDGSVARIDERTGRVVARVPVPGGLNLLAAGDAGVWVSDDSTVARIDPATNRLEPADRHRHVRRPRASPSAPARSGWPTTGGKAVADRPPVARACTPIDVGRGATYVAYGAGAVWVANLLDGFVTRVDPRTNRITARVPVAAPQSLAAGAGAAWVSTAGAPEAGTLPASACGQIDTGGAGKPDVLIASDMTLQGPYGADPRASADAIRFVLRRHGYRAGRFTVGYQSCDESTPQTGDFDLRRCAANAAAYAHDDQLVAEIGPDHSDCAALTLPTLDTAPGGPVPVISPSNTVPRAHAPDQRPA